MGQSSPILLKRTVIKIAKPVKCPVCGKSNDKSNTIKINNRYYCISCGEERQKEMDKNSNGWNGLYEYMKELYGNVDGKMFSLIAKYRKKPYNYTNEGMRLTLYYYHELLENPINEEAIGLIPYYYEKAKQEYIINMDIHKHNSSIKVKTNINRIKVKPTKNIIKYNKKIDLNSLGVDES